MRFVQFARPDNGQVLLPFFSDQAQSEAAGGQNVLSVAMSGRDLFERTRGATLMLNPNLDAVTLYPPEIDALLEGRRLGFTTSEKVAPEMKVLVGVPSFTTAELNRALRILFEREPTVRAAYLGEVHPQDTAGEDFLLLTIVVVTAHQDRILRLIALAVKTEALQMDLPLSVRFLAPDASIDGLCHGGVQIFGT